MDEYAPLNKCSQDVEHILFRHDLRQRANVRINNSYDDAADFTSTLNVLSGVLTSPLVENFSRIDIMFTMHESKPGAIISIKDLNTHAIFLAETQPVYLLITCGFTFRAIHTGNNWLVMASPDQLVEPTTE